ncbi:hypothetical protein P171DRAFT_518685 [Karstenula rhodostoma CBS 690.94]|uniref:Uncharacterized protein n=1 Tax=Karstenula rhodostoma CBS 690.94 TaxID=1392251 RepID=A0A9P4PNS0_9PLEO|nr:hypothetical protein P171DRAFT_518685 [Karstenula rhodostoma CBS 690.94]
MASENAFTFKSLQASTIRYTPNGRRIKVKLPVSKSLTTQWSVHTPENGDDDEDDPDFVGSESEELQSSDDEESEGSSAEEDDIGEELSDEDSEEFDDEIPEEEVTALLLEAEEFPVPILNSQKKARTDASPETVAAALDDKEGKKTTQSSGVEECDTVGKRDDSPAAWNADFVFALPESPPMNLSNELLFNEVFKIREIDHKFHTCRGIEAQGAQCTSNVPRSHSFSIKLLQKSLKDGMHQMQIKCLAMYNLCDEHTDQSTKLAGEWTWLANLTKAAREYWINLQRSLPAESKALWKAYGEFAAAEVRRILVQDNISFKEAERNNTLHFESQKTVESLQKKIISFESQVIALPNKALKNSPPEDLDKISALEKQINNLTTENSSLKEAQESTEANFTKQRKRDQCSLSDAQKLYRESQETVETLRGKVDALNSHIGKLETKVTALTDSLASTEGALTREGARSRELEIRLEERMAVGTKTQDSPETKLEKYLREELEKSQSHALQQQKDLENSRDEHVRLRIVNATLETQVKHIEAVKEELSRVSERETKELAEKNSDLSSQLHNMKTQLEQQKGSLAVIEKENKGEPSKSKFSLRDIYRRPKNEPSRPQTTPIDQSN